MILDRSIVNAQEIETWRQQNIDARTYLYSTINAEQQNSLYGYLTASAMWAHIQIEYTPIVADNEHLVMAKSFEYKYQPGKSLKAHISSMCFNVHYIFRYFNRGRVDSIDQAFLLLTNDFLQEVSIKKSWKKSTVDRKETAEVSTVTIVGNRDIQ